MFMLENEKKNVLSHFILSFNVYKIDLLVTNTYNFIFFFLV